LARDPRECPDGHARNVKHAVLFSCTCLASETNNGAAITLLVFNFGTQRHSIARIMQAHWGIEQTRLALISGEHADRAIGMSI
jgi:hypothetical protein